MEDNKIIHKQLSYEINGLLFKVHNELGKYCNEKQVGDLFEQFLMKNGYKYEREKVVPPLFENEKPGRNRVDFLIEGKVVVELKTKKILTREDYYQLRRYLKALNLKLGILVNFQSEYLAPKRVLNSMAKR
ncbi:GxxExxY protein [Candidatus Kuenenbacteria bacterium]|nr:GxxExxY protein [Candidatus Kuenenbacteria bacterium]